MKMQFITERRKVSKPTLPPHRLKYSFIGVFLFVVLNNLCSSSDGKAFSINDHFFYKRQVFFDFLRLYPFLDF